MLQQSINKSGSLYRKYDFAVSLVVVLNSPKHLELAETITKVEAFRIYSKNDDGFWNFEEHCTTIGSRKIIVLDDVTTYELKVQITSARDTVKLDWVKVY